MKNLKEIKHLKNVKLDRRNNASRTYNHNNIFLWRKNKM